jgi:bifunctional non-homologous end joining protein LigD
MPLAEYARKRDFTRTAEPKAVPSATGRQRFVIQKHAASRLHYDFRLELDGVLKSWAVPKGVPLVKGEKRLAVQVEDHPVSYIDFEGTIPQGQYGGGTVMVWDRGTFQTDVKSPVAQLARGKLHFTLAGKKLKGAWHLVQLHDSDQWLLIKGGEDQKPISAKLDDTSALSGKSMKQLAANGKTWASKPREPANTFKARLQSKRSAAKTSAATRAAVRFIEPMKAQLREGPPEGDDWIYEIKFDGFRTLAYVHHEDVRLLSRNEKSFNDRFPEIVEALAAGGFDDAILDGEIVALDAKGVSSFQLLQADETGSARPAIYYYVFDLLRNRGEDIQNQPLVKRKAALETLLSAQSGLVRFSAALGENAAPLLKRAEKLGLEGLVGKRKSSIYEPGRRSGAWIKLKLHREQEFVIGGFTNPEGSRAHFGALLLGFYQAGQLHFCGKVGTGFDEKLLATLHARFQECLQEQCPFVNVPEKRAGRYGAGLTAAEMRRCHWLQPSLVAQVKFSEWTREDKLRQPVFLGLREDKPATEVVRETAKED